MATTQIFHRASIIGLIAIGGWVGQAARAEDAAKPESAPQTKPAEDSAGKGSRREQMRQRLGNVDPSKLQEFRKQRQGGASGTLATVDLDALFKKLDADGDGKLSAEEFKKLADERPAAAGGKTGARGNLDPQRLQQLKQLRERRGKGPATTAPSESKPADSAAPTDADRPKG